MKEVICKVELGGGICVREFYSPVQALVRCKDCVFRDNRDGMCEHVLQIRDPDWYCADGERK